jgi:hypothetical protein
MKFDMKTAMKEAEMTMGDSITDLLAKTGTTISLPRLIPSLTFIVTAGR